MKKVFLAISLVAIAAFSFAQKIDRVAPKAATSLTDRCEACPG